jgi:preprotein translocase subunit SecG
LKLLLIGLATIVSILLIVVIVAQEPKTAGMGAAMGGDSALGGRTRGKDAVLAKMTVGIGTVFVLICLLLGGYMNTF